MLLAGMDVSGNNEIGNYKYLAIVVGTKDSINSLFKKIGKENLHMKDIRNKKERSKIIQKISFDGESRLAFCIRIDRNSIVDKINTMRQTKRKRIPTIRILKTFHYLLFQEIKQQLESFTVKHGVSISELVIQCDEDCINITRDMSLQHVKHGIAWRISDAVAWCNNRDNDPPGVIPLDLTSELQVKLAERLFR